ncbi:hypothetical protein KR51_00014610 [Rubidibacter lacunae KORDI 51-2]|uniref:FIST N domain protein n=1 Tax=Rubidibacter lacunae KORDI 51-2 TaxID=582515 RepID=U5DQG0_9CHRO|nr:FIST C-terminal domain-containing protein [Rubidibacter lacunae]ERN41925.1 hypothetical protein KR51_00014610 [Rubidibacter lacunae KORDI 51-2]
MPDQIQWATALSTRPSLEAAVAEVVELVQQSLSAAPDVGFVFISSAYASEYPRLVPLLRDRLPLPVIIGCGGGGIIGTGKDRAALEIENSPALSLSVAVLPGVAVTPFQIDSDALPDLDAPTSDWTELVGVDPARQPGFVVLIDPAFGHVNDLLEGLDYAYPGAAKVGGLASATGLGGQSGLFYYNEGGSAVGTPPNAGVVGVAFDGNLILDTLVAQGCRPVGSLLQVVQGERNIILEVTDATAPTGETITSLEALRRTIADLSPDDRELAQDSLFIGIARDEFKLELEQGDFLIRNLLGVDPRIGAIAVGDRVRPGQRLQFHLRDARTSAEDLELLLQASCRDGNTSAAGALLFSCLGRGQGLYGEEHFDSRLFQRYFNGIQVGGFFCSGEIGPVGHRTFLHGYTSAFGILRQPSQVSNGTIGKTI